MANNFSSATLGLGVDTQQFLKDIKATSTLVDRQLASMKLSADAFREQWGSMTAGIKDTKRIVSGILVSQGFYALSNALVNAGAAALSFSKNMETAAISMEYFVKGADKAAKAQAFLREMNTFAARTPFTTEQAISLSKYMQAVGVSMGTTKSFLKTITDTAAATGATEENLQRIVFGLGQMMTKGRLANEEIRQLANANIPIYEILQEKLNLTGKQISTIGKVWVPADKAVVAILSGLEERYSGAADRVADTMTGMTDTIKDNLKIITQLAGEGAYEAVANKMAVVRDALDRYREIATTQGSWGLFTQILKDIDASGELGTRVLMLVGHTRNLGEAFYNLYTKCKPVIDLLGTSFYTTLTAAEIALTGLTKFASGLGTVLEKLGITTGTTAEIISSLFIAYQAAKWMSFLGEAVAAAGFHLYNMASMAAMVLPATLQASAGVKLLTAGIAGLITYGLAAWGVFSMLNNTLSGLGGKTPGNLLPDKYAQAMEDYNAKMEEYNKKIAQYTEDFNKPFTAIDDGASKAQDALEETEKKSKKAAKSIKDSWLATFDEVFAIPKDNSAGLDNLTADLADLGALLTAPIIKFPTIEAENLNIDQPSFDLPSIYDDGWDFSAMPDKDWWKMFLPAALLGIVSGLGKAFAASREAKYGKFGRDGGTTGVGGATGPVGPFTPAGQALNVLKTMTKEFAKYEKNLSELMVKFNSTAFKSEQQKQGMLRLIDMQADELEKRISLINKEADIAGQFGKYLSSDAVTKAKNLILTENLYNKIKSFNELKPTGVGTDLQAEIARNQLATLRQDIFNLYTEAVSKNIDIPDITKSLKDIIYTSSTDERIAKFIKEVQEVRNAIISNGYAITDISKQVKEVYSFGRIITEELKNIGISNETVAEYSKQIATINRYLNIQTSLQNKKAQLETAKDILATKDARKEAGLDTPSGELLETIDNLTEATRRLEKSSNVLKAYISVGSTEDTDALKATQKIMNANKSIVALSENKLKAYVTQLIKPLKVIEKYPYEIIKGYEGIEQLVGEALSTSDDFLTKLAGEENSSIRALVTKFNQFIKDLKKALDESESIRLLDNGAIDIEQTMKDKQMTYSLTSKQFENALLKEFRNVGVKLGAQDVVIEQQALSLRAFIEKISGENRNLENLILQQSKANATVISNEPVLILNKLQKSLSKIENTSTTMRQFEDTVIRYLGRIDPALRQLNKVERDAANRLVADSFKRFENIAAQGLTATKAIVPTIDKSVAANIEAITQIGNEVPGLTATVIGDSIRDGWQLIEEDLTGPKFAKNIAAGLINADVAGAGIFDPIKVPLSGTDTAPAILGQSGYGSTVPNILIKDMLPAIKALYGLKELTPTLKSIANMELGALAEPIIGSVAKGILDTLNLSLTKGADFITKDNLIRSDFDFTIWNKSGTTFLASLDAKALSSLKALEHIAELNGVIVDNTGKIISINQEGFLKFLEASSDVGYQLITQSIVGGVKEAWIAVLDKEKAGLGKFSFAGMEKYDVNNEKVLNTIRKEFRGQASKQLLNQLEKIKDSVTLFRFEIPEALQGVVKEIALAKQSLVNVISRAVIEGASLPDLIEYISKNGDMLGAYSGQRFFAPDFKVDPTGIKELDATLRDITVKLKSIFKDVREEGASDLQEVIERLIRAVKEPGNGSGIKEVTLLPSAITGQIQKAEIPVSEIGPLVDTLKQIEKASGARTTAIITSLNDLTRVVTQNVGKQITEAINAKGKTIADTLQQIIKLDIALTGLEQGGSMANKARSMLKGGVAVPIENTYGLANIQEYLDYITKNFSEFTKAGAGIGMAADYMSEVGKAIGQASSALQDNGTNEKGLKAGQSTMIYSAEAAQKFADTIKTWTEVINPKYATYMTDSAETMAKYNQAYSAAMASIPEKAARAIDALDNAAKYTVEGMGTVSGAQVKTAFSRTNLGGIINSIITDELGNIVYKPMVADNLPVMPNIPAYKGNMGTWYSPGKEFFGTRFGKYASESSVKEGASISSGWYASRGEPGTGLKISSGAVSNAVGLIGVAMTVLDMFNTSKNIKTGFAGVLTKIAPENQEAAKQRASKMGPGWENGVFAGNTAKQFLDQYADMTKEERMFWGSLMASRKLEFNLTGKTQDYQILANALDNLSSDMPNAKKLGINYAYKGMTDEELLKKAMTDGISDSPLAAMADYVVTSGDKTSDIAKDFYKRFGRYIDTVVKPSYGVNKDWLEAVNVILNTNNKDVQKLLSNAAITTKNASDVPLSMKPLFDALIQQMQDNIEAQVLPFIQAQAKYNTGETPTEGIYSRVASGIDFSTMSAESISEIKDILGISFSTVGDNLSQISINAAAMSDNLLGWTERLPSSIKLDGTTLSAEDIAILAQAGIQINGDGTITFMRAFNQDTSGTNRGIGIDSGDLAANMQDKFAESGFSLNYGATDEGTKVGINSQVASEKMTGALFNLGMEKPVTDFETGVLKGNIEEGLAGLGQIYESGFIQITNKAVLSGEMTVVEYIKSLGDKAKDLSPDLLAALAGIDAIIQQGGKRTKESVATWADGIVVPSPFTEEQLSDPIRTAFAAAGITFEQQGENFMMVVNHLNDNLKNGVTPIPQETWDKLDTSTKAALSALGVTTTTEAGKVMVDINGAMESGIGDIIELYTNRPDLWDKIPQTIREQLATAGFSVKDGMVQINLSMLEGLANVGNEWYGSWQNLPQDAINALGAAELATSDGLIKIEKVTEATDVTTGIIKPFNELPADIQAKLTGGDASVKAALEDSSVKITNATTTAFAGAITAVQTSFGTMQTDAETGAKAIAEAVASAILEVQKLSNITVRGFNWWERLTQGSQPEVSITGVPGNWTVKYNGQVYENVPGNTQAEAAKYVEQARNMDIPGYKYGGLITEDGLYRAGEFGNNEAIIPLENRTALATIGQAIASTIDTVSTPIQRQQLYTAKAMSNAGVAVPTARNNSFIDSKEQIQSFAQATADNIAQTLAPILVKQRSSSTDDRRPIYVGTLIADDRGLRELHRKMQVIAISEKGRTF